ncbi:MAG TPA: hypothetical protein VEY91_02815 [Candidatus Limnocylindria bacterium]|nr:hypothetical protein [Candidatus Limnocylindria bacterium]
MRRHARFSWLVLAMVVAVPASAKTAAQREVRLDLADAPPPPAIEMPEEPRGVVVPRSTVFVVEDDRVRCDLFRYGVYWYAYQGGYWYRARDHRGPFRAVEVRYVPQAIHNVPARHWKRPLRAPGMKRGDVMVVRHEPGRARGRGHR